MPARRADGRTDVQAVSALFRPLYNRVRESYRAQVSKDLKKYGLRYDDLLDPTGNMDIAMAMSRLPQEVLDARNQRLKRALDLSLKHVYLPKDLQAKQTPLEPYLRPMLRQVQAEMKERKMLGTSKPYDRQLP